MSQKKKMIREKFRNEVFIRDKYTCICCGFKSSLKNCREELDAHHIQDRNIMPNGGYSFKNGVTVCKPCHELCELYHQGKECPAEYMPEALYTKIGTSYDEAYKACEKLDI